MDFQQSLANIKILIHLLINLKMNLKNTKLSIKNIKNFIKIYYTPDQTCRK